MKTCLPASAVLLAISSQLALSAANFDWPQWQGPGRNAVSKETGLLQEWPKDGPPLAWKISGLGGGYGGPSVAAGQIFGMSNRGGYLICLDFKNGNVLWNEKDPDKRRVKKGSVVQADGRIYYRTEEGSVILIEPNRNQYTERGRFEQPDRTSRPAWTHPIIANGKLYIRDQDMLFCYNVKK